MTQKNTLPEVELYSDGGASPNPGKGGYGVILSCKGVKKEFYQGYSITTNNRMELTGIIVGLSKLKTKSKVQIYTDSQYTINGIKNGWAEKWKKNGWYRTKKDKAINHDLWAKLLDLISKHEVNFNWVKGHNGHIENERCDSLATLAMDMDNLLIDENYIPSQNDQLQTNLFDEEKTNNNQALSGEIIKVLGKGNKSLKIKNVGDPCRKCLTALIKKIPKHNSKTLKKSYYYEYYLYCPNCKAMYMLEEAKRDIKTLKL